MSMPESDDVSSVDAGCLDLNDTACEEKKKIPASKLCRARNDHVMLPHQLMPGFEYEGIDT